MELELYKKAEELQREMQTRDRQFNCLLNELKTLRKELPDWADPLDDFINKVTKAHKEIKDILVKQFAAL